jgi:hypothetical protein
VANQLLWKYDQSMNVVIDDISYVLNEISHTATASTWRGRFHLLRGIFPADGVIVTVNQIGRRALDAALWVPRIFVPSSVERLSSNSFDDCQPIQFVSFEYSSRLRQIDKSSFRHCSSLVSICLPSSVGTIGCDCFASCARLQLISFEFGFRGSLLERGLFSGCSSLSTICIPDSVEELRAKTFEGCKELSVVVFEDGSRLRRIGKSFFMGCPKLRWIRLPGSLETLDGSAFRDANVKEIEFEGRDCLFMFRATGSFVHAVMLRFRICATHLMLLFRRRLR